MAAGTSAAAAVARPFGSVTAAARVAETAGRAVAGLLHAALAGVVAGEPVLVVAAVLACSAA